MSDKDIGPIKDEKSDATSGGLAAEAGAQLRDFVSNQRATSGSDAIGIISNKIEGSAFSSSFKLSDKEREEAVNGLSKNLEAMVRGDVPHLRERLKELGVSTKELDELDKKMTEKVEAARPLQEAILKGDAQALQKMVATTDPKQMAEMSELIQKNFNKQGIAIEVDYADGNLIISPSHGDRAVAISKEKLDVIGVNRDGSYDFTRHFRHENAAKELQGLADSELLRQQFRPQWQNRISPADLIRTKPNVIDFSQLEINNIGNSNKVRHK